MAVYYAVQDAGAAVAGLRREAVGRGGGRIAALGTDLTSVRCAGQWLTVGIGVDAVRGTVLSVDLLPNGETATLVAWVEALASVLGAELLVSDDERALRGTRSCQRIEGVHGAVEGLVGVAWISEADHPSAGKSDWESLAVSSCGSAIRSMRTRRTR